MKKHLVSVDPDHRTHNVVRMCQVYLLENIGEDWPSIIIDGIWGDKTEAAYLEVFGKISSTNPSEPSWYQLALEENAAGVSEIAGEEHNPRILEYHKATTLQATADEIPWCASFVSWCLEADGIESTRSARARSYQKWGKEIRDPTRGCIVVMSRGGNPAKGHVGFYSHHPDHDNIAVLGGNQKNMVCMQTYPKSRVVSYRWPIGVDVLRDKS